MDGKQKQKISLALIIAIVFACLAIILSVTTAAIGVTQSRGEKEIVNVGESLGLNGDSYELEIKNDRTPSKVTIKHLIYDTTENVPDQKGGTVSDEVLDGYVLDTYDVTPSSEVKKNYSYKDVLVTEESNLNSSDATVNNSTGEVKGEYKPQETEIDYYYTLNVPSVETSILKTSILDDGSNVLTEEDQEITYTINYDVNIDDYVGQGTITIVDTLPYEINDNYSYSITLNNNEVEANVVYDKDAKTLTWVLLTDIDTYGTNSFSTLTTISVKITLNVVYKDVNYGAASIKNNISGNIVLEDFEDENYESETESTETEVNVEVNPINATKTWIDYENSYNTRPDTITIKLLRYTDSVENAETVDDKTQVIDVTEDDAINITFTDLPKYNESGLEYTYFIEEDKVEGYDTFIDEDFNIINKLTQETTSISGSKQWHSDETEEQIAKDEATIVLLRDNVVYDTKTVNGNTEFSFTELPVYAVGDAVEANEKEDGHKYTYTLYEENVPGYVTTFDEATNTFTNTMEATGDFTVTKIWVDGQNSYSTRPNEVQVTVYSASQGNDAAKTAYTATLNAANSWTYTFEDIELYDEDGHAITYTAKEDNVLDGYDVSYRAVSGGYEIINTISQKTLGEDDEPAIEGTKTWIEPEGSERKYATFELYRNGVAQGVYATEQEDGTYQFTGIEKYDSEGYEWNYTVEECYVDGYTVTKDASGLNFTNTISEGEVYVSGTKTWITPEDASELTATIVLNKDGSYLDEQDVTGNGTYIFSGLPKYDQSDGHEYIYTVEERDVEGYTSTQDGLNFVNTINQDSSVVVEGTKTWVTPENKSGLVATIELYRDNVKLEETTVIGDNDYSFTGLDKYDLEDGHIYTYTVKEKTVEGYTSTQEGLNFVNTIGQDYTSMSVSKTWITPYNKDELEATIVLYQDGTQYDEKMLFGDASYTFTNLPLYDVGEDAVTGDGHEFNYTVSEIELNDGYHLTSSTDGEFINTIDQEEIIIAGEKVWLTEDDINELEATINLYRDEESEPCETVTVKGNNTYSFTVDKYDLEDGHIYNYTVEEERVDGYKTTGPDADGVITNTKVGETEIEISKTWEDYDNKYGYRPQSITIELVANGTKTGSELVLSDANSWEGTFKDLDAYDEYGEVITYTIEELEVDKYDTDIVPISNGYNVVNTICEEEISQEFNLIKVDSSGQVLEGVTFTITDLDGTEKEVVTDDNGEINLTLYFGTYKVEETETIYGYELNRNSIYITVNENGIYKLTEDEYNELLNS